MIPVRNSSCLVGVIERAVAVVAERLRVNDNEEVMSMSVRARVETRQQGDEISGGAFCNRPFASRFDCNKETCNTGC